MVGPLKHFKNDPDRKGRGSGSYYFRGKKYGYAKYSEARDKKRKSKRKAAWSLKYRMTCDQKNPKRKRRGI